MSKEILHIIDQINAMLIDLKAYREDSGFKLREVEEVTGISNAYLSQLECGKIDKPSWQVVMKLFLFYNNIEEPVIQLPQPFKEKSFIEKIISEYNLECKRYDLARAKERKKFIEHLKSLTDNGN